MNNKCQVFTPQNYASILLDKIKYNNFLYGKKILENSCGDGNILLKVVERYIIDSMSRDFSLLKIKKGLECDIYGIEIDPVQYRKCLDNLNKLTSTYGIYDIKWSIINADYLKKDLKITFDFIVGNPPYIAYKEIDKEERKEIRNRFNSCSIGKFDYCYAFIEKSLDELSKNGKLSYIVPLSIFKTKFGIRIRELIKKNLVEIVDYKNEIMFPGKTVKSAIIIVDKNVNKESFIYHISNKKQYHLIIKKKDLSDKWLFNKNKNRGNKRFGDFFRVSHAPVTMLNKAYVIDLERCKKQKEHYIVDDVYCLENALVKHAIAPKNMNKNKKEVIIFPYYIKNDEVLSFNETEFIDNYPGVEKYLNRFKKELNSRSIEKKTQWFEYGRSQALQIVIQKKIVMSTIISNRVKARIFSKNVVPYSGILIVKKKNNNTISIDEALSVLRSEEFLEYCYNIGIPINGHSIRVSSKDIENYHF